MVGVCPCLTSSELEVVGGLLAQESLVQRGRRGAAERTVVSTWAISIPPSKADREERARKDGGEQRRPGERVSYSFLLTPSAPALRSLGSGCWPLWWPLPPGPVHFKA